MFTCKLSMKRRALIVAVSLAVLAGAGCSGGGGGTTPTVAPTSFSLVEVSFVGHQVVPGSLPPPVFRDEALLFTFDGPLDDGIFGGFVEDGGVPREFTALSSGPLTQVPFFGYADQAAAQDALRIRENTTSGQLLASYIVGRHRFLPDTLVIQPSVSTVNAFGLPESVGFPGQSSWAYEIPAGSGLTSGGVSSNPAGTTPAELPLVIPGFVVDPPLSKLWIVADALTPDPAPIEVESISAVSGATGEAIDPIAVDDPLEIAFSTLIDPTSLIFGNNLTVTNQDLLLGGVPTPVAGSVAIENRDGRTFAIFTPNPDYGPGPYVIRVAIGPGIIPGAVPILGLPRGIPSLQQSLSMSTQRDFTTEVCATCTPTFGLLETFTDTAQQDPSNPQPFAAAEWGTGTGLSGTPISGDPLSGFPVDPPTTLGTRAQFEVLPAPLAAVPGGLFSPFDDAVGNNLGATINPAGGSHIMHLYEGAEFGHIASSLELIEWGPVSDTTFAGPSGPNDYPGYRLWCGITDIMAPLTGAGGQNGMSIAFEANYTLSPPQSADPDGLGGVLLNGPQTYTIPTTTFRHFYPFPVAQTTFDFDGSGTQNLILEQDIEPGQQRANFNRFRATAIFPIRRLIGGPLSSAPAPVLAFAGGYDIYNMRFTFVDSRSDARSMFYDTGIATPSFTQLTLSPSPLVQPTGTEARWEFQGAESIAPAALGLTPWLTYFEGSPANGVLDPTVVSQLDGKRYVRFRVTLRANHLTNEVQQYTNLLLSFQ